MRGAEDRQFYSPWMELLPNKEPFSPRPLFYRRGPTNRALFLPCTAHSGTSGFLFYHQPLPDRTGAMGSLRVVRGG